MMKIPLYVVETPWWRKMSGKGQLLFFDVCRMVHMQYGGMDVRDWQEPRGIWVTHKGCKVSMSKEIFRKARKELLLSGVLRRTQDYKSGKVLRDVFTFRIPID